MSIPTTTDFSPERDQTRAELETSVAVMDLDTMEANMREFMAFVGDYDVALRSHVKTRKNSALAHRQDPERVYDYQSPVVVRRITRRRRRECVGRRGLKGRKT